MSEKTSSAGAPVGVGPFERPIGFCEIPRGLARRIPRRRIGPGIQQGLDHVPSMGTAGTGGSPL